VTTALQSEFGELLKCGVFGLRVMSEALLARIGVVPKTASPNINALSMTQDLSERKLRAVLSLDWGARVENISRLWTEFPSLVARRFDYIWNASKTREDILRLQQEAAFSRLYKSLPPTPMLFWEKELFESVFQEVLAGIDNQFSDEDETTRIKISEIGARVLPRVHNHVANFHSRSPRPSIPLPREQYPGIDPSQPLSDSDEYAGWYRCGYFERELIIDESREYVGTITAMEGIQFHSKLDDILSDPPFMDINADFWWITGESAIALNKFSGSIVGLDLIIDLLGVCPVLVLHPALTTALQLQVATSWQHQLTFADKDGQVAVLFRSWNSRTIGERISEENVKYEGCELLMRPNIFEQMVRQIQIAPRVIKVVDHNYLS
jgi:hypothetical protein